MDSTSYTQLDVPDVPITEDPDMVLLHDKVALLPAESHAPKVVACVTGATSFVGQHIVRRLLRLGHTVHAPVRDMDDSFVGFLKAFPGAPERLKLFKVTSLVDPGAYDEAMKGCEALHHVASPFFLVGSKDQIQSKLLDPAIKGIENVLASCSKTPTMKKVILTGTCLTCKADFRPMDAEVTFSVADWEESCSETEWPYVYSKVVQEKRAIEIAASQSQYDLSIVAIGGVFGPMLSTHGTGISALILKYIRLGLFFPAVPPMGLPMNDVRDLAVYHSLVMSSPKAKGRYLNPQVFVTFYELCDGLRTDSRTWRPLLPFFQFPDFFKSVFVCAMPYLGFDAVMPERLWGATSERCKVDSSKVWRPILSRPLLPPSLPPLSLSPSPHAVPNRALPFSQMEGDLELAAQGFTPLPISTSIVDMDLTWQKYGLSFLSSSLGRAMTR